LLWIVGALCYEYLVIRSMWETGDIAGTLSSAAFGVRWRGAVLNASLQARMIKENFLFIFLNFPTPNFLLFFAGCFAVFKMKRSDGFRNLLLGLTALFLLFAFRYTVGDRYAFFIPFYCLVSIFVGLGAYKLARAVSRKGIVYLVLLFSVLPICIYAIAPGLAERMQIDLGTRGDIPFRNDYEHFLRPWKTGCRDAELFANAALEAAGDGSVICADTTTVAPLLYVQEVLGRRPDVKIVGGSVNSEGAPRVDEQTIGELLESRAVYVVSKRAGYCPAFILENYDLVEAGVLWRVAAVGEQEIGD
jgi:hypothetical protein